MTDQELDALMKRVLIDSMKLDLEADGAGQTASFAPSPTVTRYISSFWRIFKAVTKRILVKGTLCIPSLRM